MDTKQPLIYALDSGNSNAKVSAWNEAKNSWEWTQKAANSITEAEAKSGFPLVWCGVSKEIPAIVHHWKGPILSLGANTSLPFSSKYDQSKWGADRMAAVAGAFSRNKNADALIIDAGTCITVDYLDSVQGHLGGPISPGLHLRAKAMHAFTGRLPLVNLDGLDPNALPLFPTNTEEALILGAYKGWKNEIEESIHQFKKQKPEGFVYLTGGDSKYFEANPKNRIFAAPLLVFEGMVHIWKWNR
jgi:type III pantothenate kinase